jgi:putative transposase
MLRVPSPFDDAEWVPVGVAERKHRRHVLPPQHSAARDEHVRVTRKRVARLMRAARIQGVHIRRRRWRKGQGELGPAPDRVARRFRTETPDRVWVSDITSIRHG